MRMLFLDIETAPNTGYFWGLFNQNIAINQIESPGYTLCLSAKWADEKQIQFYSINDPDESGLPSQGQSMIYNVWNLLDEADVVVHYNGKKFDIPTLNREFLLMGLEPPSRYDQIDLYPTVRRQFRFASNKLDFVCQQLGIGAKVHHKGMELWTGCIEGDEKSWRIMEKYNKQDVKLLPPLYKILRPWIRNHPDITRYDRVYTGQVRCPVCASNKLEHGGYVTPGRVYTYDLYICASCGSQSRSRSRVLDIHPPEVLSI